ncbi:MAG: cystathionine gamma-synthase [Planctomycetes bacterium]|nr:cystathionine gamma-synthase [Planctomycetota bacterium]
MKDLSKLGFGTQAVHGGTEPEPITGAIMTPVFQTSTYVQPEPAVAKVHEYSRTGNPTRDALQVALATLEGSEIPAVSFASGMAAIDGIVRLLDSGDHVIAGDDLYGGTYRLFTKVLARQGLRFTFVDTSDAAAVKEALTPETKLIWCETPTNPLLKISDVSALAEVARDAGCWLTVDNTFATPYIQRPLDLGATFVVHSTTKYIGGHSDVVGGSVIVRDADLHERLCFIQNCVGAVPGPWDCFLTLRGIKTLHLRMARHCQNASAIADFLQAHPQVEKVHYPGLEGHAHHDVAARQMSAFGGMVSFELKGGVEGGRQLCMKTKLFQLAESLGGVESLIEQPATMTHASVEPEVRRAAGLADGLIRLSVGCEELSDLRADLEQALLAIAES